MKLPKFAVERPVAITMIMLVLILMGGIGLTNLPLELMPDLDLPVVVVMTEFPGAGPSEIENLVTRPLEESLQAVTNVSSVSSISQEGESQVIIEFEWGTNLDYAIQDVREQVDFVGPMLPDEAEDPYSIQFDPTEMPVLDYGVSGEGELTEIRQTVEDEIVPELERLSGVAQIDITGSQEREIQIEMDPGRIQRNNIGVTQVMEGIYASNQDLPGGDVTLDQQETLLVRTLGMFDTIEEIGDVPVAGDAGMYYLGDIAEIYDGYTDQDIIVRQDGEESLGLSIQQEADANTVDTVEGVQAELESLLPELDREINFTTIQDQAEYVNVAIETVISNAVIGGILAIIILFIFLGSFYSTIIVGVTIPVAITATFFLIYWAGLNLNMMTLGGLALGTGMLVDNSVVVTENIFRMREGGKPTLDASVDGAAEVGGPIAFSTLTTTAVFLPVVFIEGIAGEIFRDLSFSVAFSLAISLFVALTLIPMLSLKLMDKIDLEKLQERQQQSKVNRFLELVKTKYDRVIRGLIRSRAITLIVIGALFAGTIFVAGWMGQEFLPELDEGLVSVDLEMEPGTPLSDTEREVERLEAELMDWPEIEHIQSEVGVDGRSSVASMTLALVDLEDRDRSTMEVAAEVRELADLVPEASLEATNLSLVTGGDEATGGASIEVNLLGSDLNQLTESGQEVTAALSEMDILTDVSFGVDDPTPELQVQVDRKQAGNYGLTAGEIAQGVNTAIDGEIVTRYDAGDEEQVDVRLRYGQGVRESLSDIERMPLANAQGQVFPLDNVASISRGEGPVEINRIDQTRAVSIYGDHVDVDMGTAVEKVEAEVAGLDLPAGIDYEFGGETEWMQEAFDDLFLALVLAIVIVFMLLAGQFESYWQPLVVIFSVPFGLVGVVAGLLLTGRSLNVASYIGVIMMVGIVVNNAIVLLDYINIRMEGSDSRLDAISEACQIRLRPILMTTLTTVLAMFPLSLGIGEGAEIQAPIATAVIGGLLVSTVSTLIVMPVLYTVFDDLSKKLSS